MRKDNHDYIVNVSKIKGLMAENDHNISHLASVLKIHRNTLGKKLLEQREFKLSEISHIAEYYQVEVNIFLQ